MIYGKSPGVPGFLVFDLLIILSESTSTIQQTFLLDFWNHLRNEKKPGCLGCTGDSTTTVMWGLQSIFIDPQSTRDSHHFLLGLDFPRWGQVTELNLKSRADAESRCLWQLTMDVFFFLKMVILGDGQIQSTSLEIILQMFLVEVFLWCFRQQSFI